MSFDKAMKHQAELAYHFALLLRGMPNDYAKLLRDTPLRETCSTRDVGMQSALVQAASAFAEQNLGHLQTRTRDHQDAFRRVSRGCT